MRACEQVLHWRRDPSPSLKREFPHNIYPVVSVCGSVDWPHTLFCTCEGRSGTCILLHWNEASDECVVVGMQVIRRE